MKQNIFKLHNSKTLYDWNMEKKFGTQLIFLQMNITGFYVFNPDGLYYFELNIKTTNNKIANATELFKEKFWKEESLRINVLNIHFWQPMFKFRLSGQHLGLTRSFQIMECRILNQFPRRDLGITFLQVFSIKDASSSLPTSPTSAHKKWIMEHTCADLQFISAFCRCKCKF